MFILQLSNQFLLLNKLSCQLINLPLLAFDLERQSAGLQDERNLALIFLGVLRSVLLLTALCAQDFHLFLHLFDFAVIVLLHLVELCIHCHRHLGQLCFMLLRQLLLYIGILVELVEDIHLVDLVSLELALGQYLLYVGRGLLQTGLKVVEVLSYRLIDVTLIFCQDQLSLLLIELQGFLSLLIQPELLL